MPCCYGGPSEGGPEIARLRQLEAFRGVMIAGSVTQAAQLLEVSQPAVSRLIAHLEQELGFALFKRSRGRLLATPEARFLYGEVERAMADLERIGQIAEDIRRRRSGHLRIACLPGFATSLLPRVIGRLLAERPGLTLSLQPRNNERIREWIAAQQFDVGIGSEFDGHPAIAHERLAVRCVCVLPPGHALAARPVITPADLDDLPFVAINREHAYFQQLKGFFDSAGASLNIRVETRQFAPACIMVAEGVGVSIVSEIDAAEYLSRGLVTRPVEPEVRFDLAILYPAERPRSLVLTEFVGAFKESLAPFLLLDAESARGESGRASFG